ncbi:hypothetical protein GBAR_LOCUS26293 [Geodia barretti]|uniref:Uncharacterized protein n=1 Tax=Geodia barretti TaxID=519541 RepID=A0AA35TGJ3_GEOBA|nr:hypothetical protein GBAR_LOCUS26293 [Geodia barretti]
MDSLGMVGEGVVLLVEEGPELKKVGKEAEVVKVLEIFAHTNSIGRGDHDELRH